jgi:hypothetical protein
MKKQKSVLVTEPGTVFSKATKESIAQDQKEFGAAIQTKSGMRIPPDKAKC